MTSWKYLAISFCMVLPVALLVGCCLPPVESEPTVGPEPVIVVAPERRPPSVEEIVHPTVHLLVEGGRRCTGGIVCQDGQVAWVLSAYHCVRFGPSDSLEYEPFVSVRLYYPEPVEYDGVVIVLDVERDQVLIEFQVPPGVVLPVASVVPPGYNPPVLDEAWIVTSWPGWPEPLASKGEVAGNIDDHSVLVSALGYPGASGSLVYSYVPEDDRWSAWGVYSANPFLFHDFGVDFFETIQIVTRIGDLEP